MSLSEWLSSPSRAILEKVVRGKLAASAIAAAQLNLNTPLDVLANGPQGNKARQCQIESAKLKIFLDVLEELSKPETAFEFSKFEVD